MGEVNLEQYFPISLFFGVMFGFVCLVLAINALLGPKPVNSQIKMDPFECGSDPIMGNDVRISIKFYLVAIQFILFDIEIVMLYPWAIVAREIGLEAYVKAVIFIFVLTIGLIYCWKKGALEWK